jgi:Ser/Thr protein kinase RdoA (MazF antagonist)
VNDWLATAQEFCPDGQICDVQPYGEGNLNDTYLVTLDGGRGVEQHFILQRINTHVFCQPELIMLNLRTFTDHVQARLAQASGRLEERWVVPAVLPARDGSDYHVDPDGGFWRALTFVDASVCYQTVQNVAHAREAGYALGRFHSLISDLDINSLRDSLVGFHIAPLYLQHYEEVLAGCDVEGASAEIRHCIRFVAQRSEWVSVLEDARCRGELVPRAIHGDPKINNIMIDEQTGHAVSMVDLDTVKPGLVHYDIGDCLRSCCNPLGEETEQVGDVRFELDLGRAILEGYLGEARHFLTAHDYAYVYDAIRLISFELGLRFFADYLEENVYFKARHRGHNLMRALVQFKLVESIEAQEGDIRAIVASLRQ